MSDHDAHGKGRMHVKEFMAPLSHESQDILGRTQSLEMEPVLMSYQITFMTEMLSQ